MDTIAAWTENDLRRFVQTLVSTPGTLKKTAATTPVIAFPGILVCGTLLALTVNFQDIPNCSTELQPGSYLVVGIFDMEHVLNGGGNALAQLVVGGSAQTAQAVFKNTGAAAGDRATIPQLWAFTIGTPSIVKFQAKKTVNGGTVNVNTTHTQMLYWKLR